MKNIERTENAKQERFGTHQPGLFRTLPMPVNYSTNFKAQAKEYYPELKPEMSENAPVGISRGK